METYKHQNQLGTFFADWIGFYSYNAIHQGDPTIADAFCDSLKRGTDSRDPPGAL